MSKDVRALLVIFDNDLYSDEFETAKKLFENVRGVKIVKPVPLTDMSYESYALSARIREDVAKKIEGLADAIRNPRKDEQ